MDSEKFNPFCQFIKENLPEWSGLQNSDMQFQLLRGLTNEVYKVSVASDKISPNPIIFRKFNENPKLLDRTQERRLFRELEEKGYGPKCYSDNERFRLEEFIESKTLYASEYNKQNIRRQLARALAKFHNMDIPWLGRNRYLPDDLANHELCQLFEDKCDSDVFDETEKEDVKKLREITGQKEKEFIEKIFPKDEFVLSHNDLSNGNQLLLRDGEEILLIDYEFTGKNFRGFDIGYLYTQSLFVANPEFPYFKVEEKNFPTEEEFRDFIEYYLVFSNMRKDDERERGLSLIENKDELNKLIKEHFKPEDFEKQVSKLLRETKIGALACSHYIITFATKRYKTGTTKFGFFDFAKEGYRLYQKFKEEVIKDL